MAKDKDANIKPFEFKPGMSGNPGGKSKKLEELKFKISEVMPKHFARLDGIADGTVEGAEPKDSIAAIKLMWAYLLGNPRQEVTGADGGPIHMQVDYGNDAIGQMIARLAEQDDKK